MRCLWLFHKYGVWVEFAAAARIHLEARICKRCGKVQFK